jgi:VWFA-related protein
LTYGKLPRKIRIMRYPGTLARFYARFSKAPRNLKALLTLIALFSGVSALSVDAQSLQRELNSGEKPEIVIKNRNGRVIVKAVEGQKDKIILNAESVGAGVIESDLITSAKSGHVEIGVKGRLEKDRIDLTVRVPERSRVKIESEAGAVDIIGNIADAQVTTDTGTIHADVPTDAVHYDFLWESSKPRFLSDAQLPKVKEKAGGVYQIKGKLGDEKAKRNDRVELSFLTRRGVVLFNVDPNMVPSDLTERPLTEAAQAIVRSGDVELSEAIRKVSPRMFGEYTKGLPQYRGDGPSLVRANAPGDVAREVAPQLMRLNATVTDRYGRAISGLGARDFTVTEGTDIRPIKDVRQTNAPFNLVLLLDVSGSVEERMDFIRKAARNFLSTVSPQDRIAIISFRDDIQVISDFTTDRSLLNKRLDDIEAGGATSLYDALAYVLVNQIKQLRGERTAVVILSDGDDNHSFVPFNAVLEATIESGALIYPLYVPSGLIPESSVPAPSTTLDPLRTRYLTITTRAGQEARKLAEVSGGIYYPIRQIDDLQKAYDDVVAQLRMSYTITYASATNSTRRVSVRAKRDGAAVRLSPPVDVAGQTTN